MDPDWEKPDDWLPWPEGDSSDDGGHPEYLVCRVVPCDWAGLTGETLYGDKDGDGVPDWAVKTETGPDGEPRDVLYKFDQDLDGDGEPDVGPTPGDLDGDGEHDLTDVDDDNNGIHDEIDNLVSVASNTLGLSLQAVMTGSGGYTFILSAGALLSADQTADLESVAVEMGLLPPPAPSTGSSGSSSSPLASGAPVAVHSAPLHDGPVAPLGAFGTILARAIEVETPPEWTQGGPDFPARELFGEVMTQIAVSYARKGSGIRGITEGLVGELAQLMEEFKNKVAAIPDHFEYLRRERLIEAAKDLGEQVGDPVNTAKGLPEAQFSMFDHVDYLHLTGLFTAKGKGFTWESFYGSRV